MVSPAESTVLQIILSFLKPTLSGFFTKASLTSSSSCSSPRPLPPSHAVCDCMTSLTRSELEERKQTETQSYSESEVKTVKVENAIAPVKCEKLMSDTGITNTTSQGASLNPSEKAFARLLM